MNAVSKTTVAPRMTVPLLDLAAQFREIRAEVLPLMEQVCEGSHFILGPKVAELEKSIAAYSQCAHAVGVSSGTDALLVALMTLGLGAGDEVITSPYSFFATAGCVARVGARPVFCDIEPQSYNLSPASVRAFIDRHCSFEGGRLVNQRTGGRIRCLLPVHLYGQCADMDGLGEIAREYELTVIEDAAQAIGSECTGGRRAGSMGDIGCFSFFPSKNLGAFGDGGMCVLQDAALTEKLRVLRVHGGKPKYFHPLIGGNFRLDELQAAVLTVKLKRLDAWTEARQRNAAFYNTAFEGAGLTSRVGRPFVVPGHRHIFNQYVIRVGGGRRDALRTHLAAQGVGTEIYYPVPLHLQQCFAYLNEENGGAREGDLPYAEAAAKETLALPIYPELSREQLQYVVETTAGFFN
jgi:dTDP-4-amino-4,6-dideoxygalactose transaminase